MNERTSVLHARYIILIVLAVAIGIWIGEALLLKARQSHMEGLYRPTPATSLRLDCSVEGRNSCATSKRMESVR